MSDSKKDSLEQFFRKKTGEYDIPYREEDWLKLEEKLEARKLQRAYRRRLQWMAAAALLLIGAISYATYQNYTRIDRLDRYVSTLNLPGRPDDPSGTGNSGTDTTAPPAGEESGEIAGETPDLSNQSVSGDPIASQRFGGSSERNQAPATPSDLSRLPAVSLSSDAAFSRPRVSRPAFSPPEVTPVLAAADPPRPVPSDAPSTHTAEIQPLAARTLAARTPAGSRVSAGLVLSPDLSTAGALKNFHDPGYRVGLTVEYKLTPNLAVSTGLIQSKVRYAARGAGSGLGNYNNGINPRETIADCLILDIPVTLKYNFLDFTHSRFFLTTGISSYVMLNEQYEFRYDSYDPGLMQSWSGKTGAGHWMSNAGLSVGYELDIHPNWSLQVEPYIRVPLTEVGWGNVQLYSVGSFVSLRYRL